MKFWAKLVSCLAIIMLVVSMARAQESQPLIFTINAVVTDGEHFIRGNPISDSGVGRVLFSITEDNHPVQLQEMVADWEAPIYYCLMLEYSRALPRPLSYRFEQYPTERTVDEELYLANYIAKHVRLQDKVGLALFADKTNVLDDFNDSAKIINDINSIYNNQVGPFLGWTNTTYSLNEMIDKLKDKSKENRIAIIVIGTGQDSIQLGATHDQVLNNIRNSGIQVFFIQAGQDVMEDYNNPEYCRAYPSTCQSEISGDPSLIWSAARINGESYAKASGGYVGRMFFDMDSINVGEMCLLWAETSHRLTYIIPPDNGKHKNHKIRVKFDSSIITESWGKKLRVYATNERPWK